MSLIYTEGYLKNIDIQPDASILPEKTSKIKIIPHNLKKPAQIIIYENNPFEPSYFFYILNKEIILNLNQNNIYYIKSDEGYELIDVFIYYTK